MCICVCVHVHTCIFAEQKPLEVQQVHTWVPLVSLPYEPQMMCLALVSEV